MRAWSVLLLLALASRPAAASVDASGDASCDEGRSCGAPHATGGSSLLQSRQFVGKEAMPEEPEEPEEREGEHDLGQPDAPDEELGAVGLNLLAGESAAAGALAVNASGGSADVFSCPGSCQWCQPSWSRGQVQKTSDIKYGQAPNMATRMQEDLLLDKYEVPSSAIKPVMVVIHGGAWRSNSYKSGGLAPFVATTMAQHGFLALSVEYRRYGEYCNSNPLECYTKPNPMWEHPMHDVLAAVRYVRKNAAALKADPNRIALWGCSAGGINAAHAMMHNWGEGSSGNPGYSSVVQAGVILSGASFSSYQRKTSGVAPYLAFHNEVDPLVDYKYAQLTRDYLKSIGSKNKLVTLAGTDHCPNVFSSGAGGRMQDIMGFLAKFLQLPGSDCPPSNAPAPAPVPPPVAPAPVPPPVAPAPVPLPVAPAPVPPPVAPAPVPSPPSAPPAPPAGKCPKKCRAPTCQDWSGSGSSWRGGKCVGYCSKYRGQWLCADAAFGKKSKDCSGC